MAAGNRDQLLMLRALVRERVQTWRDLADTKTGQTVEGEAWRLCWRQCADELETILRVTDPNR